MAIDLADPRFWLVHVAGPSTWADELVASNVRRATDLDWCWLPMSHLDAMQALGRTRWFKSDFEGDELLGDHSEGARRLKVQLEGRDADRLRRYIAELPEYRTANSLTGLAVDVENSVGTVREAAHYRGSFKVAGDSFDAHQLFLGAVVSRYASSVRRVEAMAGIRWERAGETGRRFVGGVIEIKVNTRILDRMTFAEQLLSAREPFRLWGIPTAVGEDIVEAEAVDLHIGKAFRLDILESSLRLYLDAGVCGNTVFRLLANLQHRYDATATAWLGQELVA